MCADAISSGRTRAGPAFVAQLERLGTRALHTSLI